MPVAEFTVQQGFVPTQPVSGNNNGSLYRAQNLWIRGARGRLFAEVFGGILNIGEAVANTTLTGTVAVSAGSTTITGTGTKFIDELIPNQLVLINGRPVSVRSITSDTVAIASQPCPTAAAGSGLSIVAAHILIDVDIFRGSLARGNILRTARGNLYFVGQGIVRLNGTALTGSPSATPQLKLAIFNADGGTYTIYKLGFKTPTLTTVAAVAGGTKNMQGVYSVMIAPARTATGGFNNPSEAVQTAALTVGQKIRITFPAMDTAAGQDAWRVYGTLMTTDQGISGPWYYVDTVNTTQVSSAGGTYDFEWRDAEIDGDGIAEFNNDPPPAATFLSQLANYPILIGCNGPGRVVQGTVAINSTAVVTGMGTKFDVDLTVGSWVYINNAGTTVFLQVLTVDSATQFTATYAANATASGLTARLGDAAPGPVCRPCKPGITGTNSEAYPASYGVAVNPPETIIGIVTGVGRIYTLTENRLDIVTLSGQQPPYSPITVRPFWHVGFRNPQACCFVNGKIYGFTTNGATRSVEDGDEGSEEFSFAADVYDVMKSWAPEFTRVCNDPVNSAVVFIYSPPDANASGFYATTALAYMLQTETWSSTFIIESTSINLVASGAATVGGKLYQLLSGQTYGWDTGGGINGVANSGVPWNGVWAGFDGGDSSLDKAVIYATGTVHTGGGALAISGSKANQDVALDAPISGTAVSLPVSTTLQTLGMFKYYVKELRLFAPFLSGTWFGTGLRHRVDKWILHYTQSRMRH